MNIDEFLNSQDSWFNVGGTTFIKIKYNNEIDYIYRPFYRWDLYEDSKLSFVGIFDKIHNKLYGSETYLNSKNDNDLNSKYYVGNTESINKEIYKEMNILLENYIKNNKGSLMEMAQPIFKKYISKKENYDEIRKKVTRNYIYSKSNSLTFSFSSSSYKFPIDRLKLVENYIKSPAKTSMHFFEEYIYSDKEISINSHCFNDSTIYVNPTKKLGFDLLILDYENKIMEEIKNNPSVELQKKREIINCIDTIDAKSFNITLKHNDNVITFKYPKSDLHCFYFDIDNIMDIEKRNLVANIFMNERNLNDLFVECITKIEYRNNIVYEYNLTNNEKEITTDSHDIVDEMFD